MPDRASQQLGEQHRDLGEAVRDSARERVLTAGVTVVPQRDSGDSGDVIGVDERHSPIAGWSDQLAPPEHPLGEHAGGEVLRKPRRTQDRPGRPARLHRRLDPPQRRAFGSVGDRPGGEHHHALHPSSRGLMNERDHRLCGIEAQRRSDKGDALRAGERGRPARRIVPVKRNRPRAGREVRARRVAGCGANGVPCLGERPHQPAPVRAGRAKNQNVRHQVSNQEMGSVPDSGTDLMSTINARKCSMHT